MDALLSQRPRMGRLRFAAAVLLAGLAMLPGCGREADGARPPALVLFVVVDQLRGDMPARFATRFGPGGFRWLMDEGLWFRDARYSSGVARTCPGFATLVTGATPAQHGIVANGWYEAREGRGTYCLADPGHALLGEATQRDVGTSPRNLRGSTFGDELVAATGGASRVFAVAGKDRGAILPAGHLGKAFWYSRHSGRFTSSDYYFGALPAWVRDFNASTPASRHRDASWTLLEPVAAYRAAAHDDRPWERDKYGLGRRFPHSLSQVADEDFFAAFRYTPFADELLVDFALALLEEERLGAGETTDVLAVALSSTDYVGHGWGPESLEAEDNLLRVDRQLARLLAAVDARVGLDRTLVVLASDHGIGAAPETLARLGYETGRLSGKELAWALQAHLAARHGTEERLVAGQWLPGIWLDEAAIAAAGLEPAVIAREAGEFLAGRRGVYAAYTAEELAGAPAPADPVRARIASAFDATRSGHLYVVQSPGWFLDAELAEDAATHGSPWTYDLHVPVILAGAGIPVGSVGRRVAVEDLAPTLSQLLGVLAPSMAEGVPWPEATGDHGAGSITGDSR